MEKSQHNVKRGTAVHRQDEDAVVPADGVLLYGVQANNPAAENTR